MKAARAWLGCVVASGHMRWGNRGIGRRQERQRVKGTTLLRFIGGAKSWHDIAIDREQQAILEHGGCLIRMSSMQILT